MANGWVTAATIVAIPLTACAVQRAETARVRRARQQLHDRSCFKKNTLKPHRREQWVIPPKANSAFVAAMEDVLAVYTRPRNSDRPLVCLDETSKQLIAETRLAIPMKPAARPVATTSTSATASPISS